MKYDVGIILSHWLKEDGSLSDETRERVDLGIDLLERGVVGGLVMTGDHKERGRQFKYKLCTAMKNYAVSWGVDPKAIFEEDVSLETVGNLFFSKIGIIKPMGYSNVAIVSHDHHITRSREIAQVMYGTDYKLGFFGVESLGKVDVSNLDAFRKTFEGVRPGDDEAILKVILEKHGVYNKEPDYFRERLKELRKMNSGEIGKTL